MNHEHQPYEEMTNDELGWELRRRDWNIGERNHSSYGVSLLFRKHYTAHFGYPGVETRSVFGKDESVAIRTFLKALDDQDAVDDASSSGA